MHREEGGLPVNAPIAPYDYCSQPWSNLAMTHLCRYCSMARLQKLQREGLLAADGREVLQRLLSSRKRIAHGGLGATWIPSKIVNKSNAERAAQLKVGSDKGPEPLS